MKNILKHFKINPATYFLILSFLLTGLIKNIIIIYLIVIIHELGHILMIKKLNYNIIKVEIYPMGGITSINKKINTSIKNDLLIASFGVFFQVLLGCLVFFLLKWNLISIDTYELFKNYNKTIMLFNLLPIIPLDGYHIMNNLLEMIFPYKKSFYISIIISIISVFLFITYNTLYSLNNYLIITFLIYKIITSIKDFKYNYLKFLMERYLYRLPYHKIKYHKKENLDVLKKDTYHFFKKDEKISSEREILRKKFDK